MKLRCEVCGSAIERSPSDIRGHVYCSKRCEGIGKRGEGPFPWEGRGMTFSAYCDRADTLLRAEIRARRGGRLT